MFRDLICISGAPDQRNLRAARDEVPANPTADRACAQYYNFCHARTVTAAHIMSRLLCLPLLTSAHFRMAGFQAKTLFGTPKLAT